MNKLTLGLTVAFPPSDFVLRRQWRNAGLVFISLLLAYLISFLLQSFGIWRTPLIMSPVVVAVHAFAVFFWWRNHTRNDMRPTSAATLTLAIAALLYLSLALTVALTIKSFRIAAISMAPELIDGDHVLVRTIKPSDLQRGDVVVFRSPEDRSIYIKRILAKGGDHIRYRGQAFVLNDVEIDDTNTDRIWRPVGYPPWLQGPIYRETLDGKTFSILVTDELEGERGETRVPEGHFFLAGDNRNFSRDSRLWGTLNSDYIIGKAIFVWWSDTNANPLKPRLERIARKIE